MVITGGCGFIGTNLAHRLASSGQPVLLLDNLSRPGVDANRRWLQQTHPDLVQVQVGDVRDPLALSDLARARAVFHLAAQVAVTTSLQDPLHDFDVNARGTLHLLEALRALPNPPPLLFASTNKVYGRLSDLALEEQATRYEPADPALRAAGISELRPLDFHSPYGCSKGAADQYVLDYARTFSLPAAVFRLSCTYGPHQCGSEHQGWVAHFLSRALAGQPITVYGDGKQVRDLLFIDDLVDAMLLAHEFMPDLAGQLFQPRRRPREYPQPPRTPRPPRSPLRPPPRSPLRRLAPRRPTLLRRRYSQVPVCYRMAAQGPPSEGVTRLLHWLEEQISSPAVTPAEFAS